MKNKRGPGDMAEMHRTTASLRFHGDVLDPEEISRILGVKPTTCVKKGDLWETPRGAKITARTGYWSLSAPNQNAGNLETQLTEMLSLLSEDLEACRSLAASFRGNIFVGLFLSGFNEGLSLSPTTITAIGLRGLTLDIDVYSGGDLDQQIA